MRKAEGENERPASAWYENRQSLRYRALTRVARLTRGRISSPELYALAKVYEKTDAEKNAEGRLRADQHAATWAIWATEAYTPANLEGLYRGLEKLSPARGAINSRDPAAWLKQQRNSAGSSFYLHLSNPGSSYLPSGFEVHLPPFAQSAIGTIWTATPFLTLLTVAFVLTDEERCRLDRILHADYRTRLETIGGRGISIHSPVLERRRLVREARKDWSTASSAWFIRHLPGLLGSTSDGVATCEMTVVENLIPFLDDPTSDRQSLMAMDALSIRTNFGLFRTDPDTVVAKFVFAPQSLSNETGRRHSIVAMTKDDFLSQNASSWGASEDRFLYAFETAFRGTAARWALIHVLSHYHQRIVASRDLLANVVGSRSAATAIAHVRRDMVECADAATIARDVRIGISNFMFDLGSAAVLYILNPDGTKKLSFRESLGKSLTTRATQLLEEVGQLNATRDTQAALLSAHSNLRLQPWIILLAIVSAIASTIAAISPARDLIKWSTERSNLPAGQAIVATKPDGNPTCQAAEGAKHTDAR